jgi:DNA polymerase I-like protein with 3'-5' exonuclease and polymerase domains
MAHLSGDPSLCDLFQREGDVYRMMAALIMKKPVEQVCDEERTKAKVRYMLTSVCVWEKYTVIFDLLM